jgi:hypothetical protein
MLSAEEAYDIINSTIIPEAIERFHDKQRDYSGGPAFMFLGTKGQFSDMNRKFWKLYQALWEGKPLEGESEEEVLFDFFGHVLLAIFGVRAERGEYNQGRIEITYQGERE